jgi:hypothetical protein
MSDATSHRVRRFAYADPPYPGQSFRHYRDHADYAGEVDHEKLIGELERDFPDGWALSTSAAALPYVLSLCPQGESSAKRRRSDGGTGVKLGTGVRIGVWRRTGAPFPPSRVMWAWEPVIFRTPHWRQRHRSDFIEDIVYATQPRGFLGNSITGQKPPVFCHWVFDFLGATPDDELVDVFPGSGAVGHEWAAWCRQRTIFQEQPA